MEFVANEVKFVQSILEKKQLTPRKATKELRLVVQYHLALGHSLEDAVDLTVDLVNQVNGDNSGERWRKTLSGMAKDLLKKNDLKMRVVEEITITKNEWIAIEKLEKDHIRRYAFGLLVYSKVLNNDKNSQWVAIDNTSAFLKDVGVSANAETREKYFNVLKKEGMITNAKKAGSLAIRVDFEEKEGESFMVIPEEQIKHFITYYEEQYGSTVANCQLCNGRYSLSKTKGRKPVYCKDCTKERNRLRKQKEREC